MACECIKTVNEKLLAADTNTKISLPIFMRFDGKPAIDKVMLVVEKADKNSRKKPSALFPTFCPFCGVKYEAD